MAYKNYRPCIVDGKRATFHRWVEHAEIVEPAFAIGGHNGGNIKWTTALVEYGDGRVAEVLPREIRFTEPPAETNRKEKAEFACRVCFEKFKRDNPNAINCAWRGIDNEYCPELKKILESEDAKQ